MSFMPMGKYVEGCSRIHKMDGFAKLICMLLLLTAIICSDTAVGYGLVIVFVAVIIRLSEISVKAALGGVGHMYLFFLIIFLMNAAFFETDNSLWSWWLINISVDGIVQGIQVVLNLALVMVLSNVLLATTSPLDITGAIESLISPLGYLRIPVHDVAMILGVAIQFIPIFIEESEMIKKAQTARGARFESKKFLERAQSVIPMVVPIFISAFRRADELSLAMEARGYRRTTKRLKYRKRKIYKRDIIGIIFSVIICAIEIYGG